MINTMSIYIKNQATNQSSNQATNQMLSVKIRPMLEYILKNPQALKRKCPELILRLQSQGKEDTDGTGNKVTNHEAAFAQILNEFGFEWIPKKKKDDHLPTLPKEGHYYIYQANGTQQAIDFRLLYIANNTIKTSVDIDCKYTTNNKVFLNDGWFEKDIMYVMTWNSSKTDTHTFVGIGSSFTTPEEILAMEKHREQKKKLNECVKKVGNLYFYIRSANQFSLKGFTPEFTTTCMKNTIEWLSSLEPFSLLPLPSPQPSPQLQAEAHVETLSRVSATASQFPQLMEEEPHSQLV
jgi:hypothetical protein